MQERLQKILSAAGVCSRRSAEGYIADGRVTVNGAVASVGDKADREADEILVDGRPLGKPDILWLMLYKPRGYVTTLSDEKGRKTVADLVADCGCRVWPVGRLDIDTEGLLLMTNDGRGTYRLAHPKYEVEKEYQVSVKGDLDQAVPILAGPMRMDGHEVTRTKVKVLRRTDVGGIISITIHQGFNRQVRRMCDMAGLTVVRLARVREGMLRLRDLKQGEWRRLTDAEMRRLFLQ